jgi:hypothetical protein
VGDTTEAAAELRRWAVVAEGEPGEPQTKAKVQPFRYRTCWDFGAYWIRHTPVGLVAIVEVAVDRTVAVVVVAAAVVAKDEPFVAETSSCSGRLCSLVVVAAAVADVDDDLLACSLHSRWIDWNCPFRCENSRRMRNESTSRRNAVGRNARRASVEINRSYENRQPLSFNLGKPYESKRISGYTVVSFTIILLVPLAESPCSIHEPCEFETLD